MGEGREWGSLVLLSIELGLLHFNSRNDYGEAEAAHRGSCDVKRSRW